MIKIQEFKPNFEPIPRLQQATGSVTGELRSPDTSGSELIINVLIELKADGKAEATLKGISKRLRYLSKHCDLSGPEEVRRFISNVEGCNAYKELLAMAYLHYCRFLSLPFRFPNFVRQEREIQLPSEENPQSIILSRRNHMVPSPRIPSISPKLRGVINV